MGKASEQTIVGGSWNKTRHKTLREVADVVRAKHKMQCSVQHVSNIEKRALGKVKVEFVKWLEGRVKQGAAHGTGE